MHDFHTHDLQATNAIINLPIQWMLHPELFQPREGATYSAGIHPWWTDNAAHTELMLQNLPLLLEHPQVIALGECGLDALRGASLEEQERIFRHQIRLAEAYNKPVTLHIVRTFDRLLRLHKELHPTTQWTIHGFRGRPALARQLLAAGLDLSFGLHFNPQSWNATPEKRRHTETDSNEAQ